MVGFVLPFAKAGELNLLTREKDMNRIACPGIGAVQEPIDAGSMTLTEAHLGGRFLGAIEIGATNENVHVLLRVGRHRLVHPAPPRGDRITPDDCVGNRGLFQGPGQPDATVRAPSPRM